MFTDFITFDNHIYVYIRVSTDKQDSASQLNEVYNYCVKNRLYPPLNNVFIDENISGKINWKNRKIFNIIEQSKKGNVIIVPEISRLGRNIHDVNQIIATCIEKKINVVDIKNNIKLDGTFQSDIMYNLYSIFSRMERELISERTKQGMLMAKENNKQIGRVKGFRQNKLDEHITKIIELIKNKQSTYKIAKELNVSQSYMYEYIKKNDLLKHYDK